MTESRFNKRLKLVIKRGNSTGKSSIYQPMIFPAKNQAMGDFPPIAIWSIAVHHQIRICLIAKQKNVIGSMAIPIGSMVLLYIYIYMVTWIPSIYPSRVSIYTIHESYGHTPLGLEIVEKIWPIDAENRRGTEMGMALPFFPGEDPPIFRTRRSESCTSSEPVWRSL